jgi:Leucine-rich repeat (LRR) protein
MRLEITASCVNLRNLNGRRVSVADRVQAMLHFPQRYKSQDVSINHWFFVLKSIPEISALSRWDPASVVDLSLPNCGLITFNVSRFTGLISLNLSNNHIDDLDGSGLVFCRRLVSLDLSRNQISKPAQLLCIACLCSLRHLWLEDNPQKDYREFIACPSLFTLDGIPVAVSEISSPDSVSAATMQLKIAETPPQNLFSFELVNRGLNSVDVSALTSLTHLVLRGNCFQEVHGLRNLANLVLLDVSHNPSLHFGATISSLAVCPRVQHLMCAVDCWCGEFDHILSFEELFCEKAAPMSVRNRQYRDIAVHLIMAEVPSLCSFDRIRITIPERINILKEKKSTGLEDYRTNLAILQGSIPESWADLRPSEVAVGKQYSPEDVISLRNLSGCELTNNAILEFSNFSKLVELDLSRNRLTTITPLNLHLCPSLKYVDVSFNNISDQPETVAEVIDSIQMLVMFSIRANPTVNSQENRDFIISRIHRLTNPSDTFRVLDIEISPRTVFQTHNMGGCIQSEKEARLCYSLALKFKISQRCAISNITHLNLDHCSLSYVDFSPFKALSMASLKGNKIESHQSIIGLNDIKSLRVLNLQDNLITEIEAIATIIALSPSLKNIGVSGNPCATGKYRSLILQHLPSISKPACPFMAIDDEVILPMEIFAVSKGCISDFDRLCLELSVARNKPREHLLDLSNSMIKTCLDLTRFKSIRLLSIQGNLISTKTLANSGIIQLTHLEFLDVSNNLLSDELVCSVGSLLSVFKKMRRLEIHHNPVCPLNEDWQQFLHSFTFFSDVLCPLGIINGHELTLDDRLQVLSSVKAEFKDAFRCEWLLTNNHPNWKNSRKIIIPQFNIIDISPISMAMQLKVLDISHNKIKRLAGIGLEKLVFLNWIDISENEIRTIEEVRDSLALCPNLEYLNMVRSTMIKEDTLEVDRFIGFICLQLRGLVSVDHRPNPKPLKEIQRNAIKDIEQLTGWNNPNHIHNIDLSDRGIDETNFMKILESCVVLAPQIISFEGNPCCRMDKYRYLIIFNLPDIQQIDGSNVTLDQRMNADKSVRAKTEGTMEKMITDGALVLAEYIDEDERNDFKDTIQTRIDYAMKLGTTMMKWEIFITFQQMLALIVNMIPRIKWPRIFIDFSWIVFPFTIDFSFLSYLLDIRLPFWYQYASFFVYILFPAILFCIYHFQPNRDYWTGAFTKGVHRTIILSIFGFFVMLMCSAGIAFITDLNYTLGTGNFSNNQFAWLTVLITLSIVFFVSFLVMIYLFYRDREDPVIWFKAMKMKKRATLFVLTVMYFPVCKAFVDCFSCMDGHLKAFVELDCINSFEDFHLVHTAAAIFGLIYAVGIPAFFITLINIGVHDIDLNYRIDARLKQLAEDRAAIKKKKSEGEDTIEEEHILESTEKDIEQSYSKAAIEYENAAAYLYNCYERKDRYQKVSSMIEKLIFLIFSTVIDFEALTQAGVTAGLMLATTIYQIICHPLTALHENILQSFSKILTLLLLTIGEILHLNLVKLAPDNEIELGLIMIILVLLFFLAFFFYMIKTCFELKDEVEEALKDDSSSGASEVETSDTDTNTDS